MHDAKKAAPRGETRRNGCPVNSSRECTLSTSRQPHANRGPIMFLSGLPLSPFVMSPPVRSFTLDFFGTCIACTLSTDSIPDGICETVTQLLEFRRSDCLQYCLIASGLEKVSLFASSDPTCPGRCEKNKRLPLNQSRLTSGFTLPQTITANPVTLPA